MIRLLKTNDTHKTISFCILTPGVEDRNGDVISEDEIIKTAHDFGRDMSTKYLNVDHKDGTKIDKANYDYVESFIAPNDIIVWESIVKKWSWYVWIKFYSKDLYNAIIAWEYVWVSMEWYFIKED